MYINDVSFFVCRKLVLGKYLWRSFYDFAAEATRVSTGFAKMGLVSKSKVAFLAETRAEWISKITFFKLFLTHFKLPITGRELTATFKIGLKTYFNHHGS